MTFECGVTMPDRIYRGYTGGRVTVKRADGAEVDLVHYIRHSHASWRWNALQGVELDMAIRAQELEVLGVMPDLGRIGLESTPPSATLAHVPILLVDGVSVVQMQGGSASVVAATAALPAELYDELRTLGTLSIPEALLAAWPAHSYIPLAAGIREGLAAIDAESRGLEIDAAAVVGAIATESTPAGLAAPLFGTGSAELSLTVGAVGDEVTASFTIQRRVWAHHSMIQAQVEGPFGWGYGGSGPADLARCLLIDALGQLATCATCAGSGTVVVIDGEEMSVARAKDEYEWGDPTSIFHGNALVCNQCEDGTLVEPSTYQTFKFDVIAGLPVDQPWTLQRSEILAWHEAYASKEEVIN